MNASVKSDDNKVLQDRYENAVEETMQVFEAINKRLKVLEEKETHWKEIQAQVEQHAQKASSKIKLDVGGKVFATYKTTLLNAEGSYFHAMLASGKWKPDEDGTYFIDTDPKFFDRILNYLRTGKLDMNGLEAHQKDRLKKSAEYFQIKLPTPSLTWDPSYCGKNLCLSEDKLTVTKRSSSGEWDAGVLGSIPCNRFSLRIDHIGINCEMMIGFATKEGYDINGDNAESCGWYFDACYGELSSENNDTRCSTSYHHSSLKVGNVLTAIWDQEKKEISFELDGVSLGVAFTSVDREKLYPAVDILDKNLRVTLV